MSLSNLTQMQRDHLDRAVQSLIKKIEWVRQVKGIRDDKRCFEEAISLVAWKEYIPHLRLREGYAEYLQKIGTVVE